MGILMCANSHQDQKARDELEFEPLPSAPWLSVGEFGIIIKVNYSEELSRRLNDINGSKWDAGARVWSIPFTSARQLRDNFDTLDRLSTIASADAAKETLERQKLADARTKQREYEAREREKSRL